MRMFVAALLATVVAQAAEFEPIVDGWLAKQTNIQTWTAAFTQTRTLKGLAQPLVSTGSVWFAAPQDFRWELGRDHTIAIRKDDTMLVVYPRLKRAEKYSFDGTGRSEWKDTLALLQSGFPRSRSELNQQFTIVAVVQTNSFHELQLQPKSAGARKLMPRINVLLSTNLALAGTELVFVDGSRMRNEFHSIETNATVSGKFDLTVPADFKLVEPMKGTR